MEYVDNLIDESIRHDCVAHGTYTERAHNELLGRLTSDDADWTDVGDYVDYWGTDDDGGEWRVKLHRDEEDEEP